MILESGEFEQRHAASLPAMIYELARAKRKVRQGSPGEPVSLVRIAEYLHWTSQTLQPLYFQGIHWEHDGLERRPLTNRDVRTRTLLPALPPKRWLISIGPVE